MSKLRFAASGLSVGAATCVIVAICATYSFVGADAHPATLHDSDGTLAFNIAFVALLSLAGLLTLPRTTVRLGLGLAVGTGLVLPGLFVADIVGMFRSGPSGASDYVAPGVGFYWGVISAGLAIGAAASAAATLRRGADFQFAPTRASALWAALGLLCAAAWLVGTWLPWQKQELAFTPADGTPQTLTYGPCCSLSNMPAQWAIQAVVVAVLIVVACLVSACLRSAAITSGILLAACVCSASSVLSALWSKPYTLAELAPGLEVSEYQLTQVKAVVSLHRLPGVWITSAAALGLLLLAVVRGLHAAATAPQATRSEEATAEA
ncbi:hypothetical protein [Streptomyces regalis]|uniref:hypothetical protein n=1 Tax=Streptomyces regalis TaxID=68262 RepID=UPI000B10A201|nr:hypothetical protein [Streptomyces regalis]